MRAPPDAVRPANPLTTDWLCERILACGCCVPPGSELAKLATLLSMINAAYENTTNLVLAADTRRALWVLMHFFDVRRQACEKAGVDPRIAKSERRLCDQFDSFMRAVVSHTYALDMDAGGLMRPYETWRDFALWIGHAFLLALKPSNKNIGFSNTGPIAQLTTEAVEAITGEKLKVYNVGQHLKQPHPKKRPGKNRSAFSTE
jgi:hypothetical protein